ncbi:MAG TPA: hypothetical protein VJ757_13320 [Pseudonocardiaceae bacterium]|nr:hypothetical protein [Pseudonocardiaceae bacterium]
MNSADQALQAGISIAMAAIACWILIPLVFASLCTGLILAVGTSWGLSRHWWLIAKSGIAAVLTVTGVVLILPRLSNLLAGEGEPLQLRTVALRSAALVLLLVATGLSVVKPWGKTRFAASGKTSTTATVPAPVKARTADPLVAVRPNVFEPRVQQARTAQLHALRALHGQRDLRAVSDEPGSRGCRVLVIGSRTWIDPTNVATTDAVTRPQARAVSKSHWPRSPLRRSVARMRA